MANSIFRGNAFEDTDSNRRVDFDNVATFDDLESISVDTSNISDLAFVSLESFGVSPTSSASDNTANLQLALDKVAGEKQLQLPNYEVLVNATLRIPSNSSIGGTPGQSVIKMDGSVGRDTPVVVTGSLGDKRENIYISGVEFNANISARADIAGGDYPAGAPPSSNFVLCNSENVAFEDCRFIGGSRHCLDVTAPSDGDGTTTWYDPEPSRNVWINRCHFEDGGDDNLTIHHSAYVWITNCTSYFPNVGRRRSGTNSNCIEVDDGARNIFIDNVMTRGGDSGLQIKAHSAAAAPYNIQVDNYQSYNARVGLDIYHTGHDATTISPNARNIQIGKFFVIAPHSYEGVDAEYGLKLHSYENVSIDALVVSDGTDQLAKAYDGFVVTDILSGIPVRIADGAKNVSIDSLQVHGFAGFSDRSVGVYNSIRGHVDIRHLSITKGPQNGALVSSGANKVRIDSYKAERDTSLTGAGQAIFMGTISESQLGLGSYTGYTEIVVGNTIPATSTSSPALAQYGSFEFFQDRFRPRITGTNFLGDDDHRFSRGYFVSAPDVSSDERMKKNIQPLSDAEIKVAKELRPLLRQKWQWREEVSDETTWHVGPTAQQIVSAFERHGIDATDYDMLKSNGDRYSVAYQELHNFIIGCMEE